MGSDRASIPIDQNQLSRWTEQANSLLVSVKWVPKPLGKPERAPGASVHEFRESSLADSTSEDKLSLITIAKTVSRDPVLISEHINHVLSVVREGLRIGMHLSSLYTKHSGLQTLIDLNARGGLSDAQKTEFRAKYETASAVTVFSCAYYVRWSLANYRPEEVSSINMLFTGIPEVHLLNPVRALDCLVYYYAAYLEKSGVVNTDLDFVKMTLLYFESAIDEIKVRAASLKNTEAFVEMSYRLTGTDFAVNGFEADLRPRETSIEFNRVELGQIVGNRDAKHKARRLAERLICYDPATRRNPVHDMGGLQTLRMGHGEPGTGKSLQIAATATLLSDYCKNLGLPFLFWPMPDTIVSTFQGGSAERMMDWMRPLRDPTKIIYAPIDDAENSLEDRTRQGVSAGVREVIAVFLRNTEGAYAVNYGNAVIELFTNLPDQLDKAVLSRIMDRVYIRGADSVEDFVDQDYLWWRKYEEAVPGFVAMKAPARYKYLEKQKLARSLSAVYETVIVPSDEKLQEIFKEVKSRYKPDEHEFFATLYRRVQDAFPLFTSRDVRNIQQAVGTRIMDFDLEPEWLEKPELFFTKDYDTKRQMLSELMKANMKGLKFAEVRLQETVRYLDSMVKIVSAARERQLSDMLTQMELREEAAERFARTSGDARAQV